MPEDSQPPDLVPGDSPQPSNQPIEDETSSGEWPDPKAPPQAPAPGSDPEEADPVAGGSKVTPD